MTLGVDQAGFSQVPSFQPLGRTGRSHAGWTFGKRFCLPNKKGIPQQAETDVRNAATLFSLGHRPPSHCFPLVVFVGIGCPIVE